MALKPLHSKTSTLNNEPRLTQSRSTTLLGYLACKGFGSSVQAFVLLSLCPFFSLNLPSTKKNSFKLIVSTATFAFFISSMPHTAWVRSTGSYTKLRKSVCKTMSLMKLLHFTVYHTHVSIIVHNLYFGC